MQSPSSYAGVEDDKPNFLYALIGFLVPLIGLIIYFACRAKTPLKARSAGRGALLKVGLVIITFPVWAAVLFPVFARARENARRASCQTHMKQLAIATMAYASSHNETYPDISTPQAIQALVGNKVSASRESVFSCPATKVTYVGNPNLSLRSLNDFPDMGETIMFYEADNSHLEGCNVAFADGHIKWLRQADWQALKLKNGFR